MNQIKIFNWNVNGLRAILKKHIINHTNFQDFIEKQDYTIIALQEVKLNDKSKHIIDNIFLKYPYRYYSLTDNSRSGVVIFSKIKANKVIYDLNQKDLRFKGRCLTLEFNNFYYTNVYQPNSGDHLKNLDFRCNKWDPIFGKFILKLIKKKQVIISGDLNVVENLLGTYNSKHYNKLAGVTQKEMNNFKLLLKDFNIVKTNGNYTYFSYRFIKSREYNKGLAIDHFLISNNNSIDVKKIEVLSKIYGLQLFNYFLLFSYNF